jgi:hypothetical protein
MLAQKFGAFRVSLLAPVLSFGFHLSHADRDLCRAKLRDWDRIEKWLTCIGHRHLPIFLQLGSSNFPAPA